MVCNVHFTALLYLVFQWFLCFVFFFLGGGCWVFCWNSTFLFGKSIIRHRPDSILTVSFTFSSRAYGFTNRSCTRVPRETDDSQVNSKKCLVQQYAHIWLLVQFLFLTNENFYYEEWNLHRKLNKWTGPFYTILNRKRQNHRFSIFLFPFTL